MEVYGAGTYQGGGSVSYTHLDVYKRQGKETLRMDKVNQVLALFGHKVGAVPIRKEDEE